MPHTDHNTSIYPVFLAGRQFGINRAKENKWFIKPGETSRIYGFYHIKKDIDIELGAMQVIAINQKDFIIL